MVDSLGSENLSNHKVRHAVARRLKSAQEDFPGCVKVRQIHLLLEPWPVESGPVTPTMKVEHIKVLEQFVDEVDELYLGSPAH